MRLWTAAAATLALSTMHFAPVAYSQAKPAKVAKPPATPAKLIEVRICPISNMAVEGEGAGHRIVKNYKAYFC